MNQKTAKFMVFLLFCWITLTIAPAAHMPEHKDQKKALNRRLKNAIIKGDIAQAEKLLRHGADVQMRDDTGRTLLQKACKHNKIPTIQMLLPLKADINCADDKGTTPLMEAAKHRHLPVVDQLLNMNADANAQAYDEHTALSCAIMADDLPIIQRLLQANAYINQRLKHNSTPLMWAVEAGNIDATKLLLLSKADPQLCDHGGWTALDLTHRERKPNPELEQILILSIEQWYEDILLKAPIALLEQKKPETEKSYDEKTGCQYIETLITDLLNLDIDSFEEHINILCSEKKLDKAALTIYLREKKGRSGDTIVNRFEEFRECLNAGVYDGSVRDINAHHINQLLCFAAFFQQLGIKPIMPQRYDK